jgi:hypothetical protein
VFAVALDDYLHQLETFLRSSTERQTTHETATALRVGIHQIRSGCGSCQTRAESPAARPVATTGWYHGPSLGTERVPAPL